MQEYSPADLRRLFGLPPTLIHTLGLAGYISKSAPEGKSQYSFQDLLVLRMAGALKAAKISSPKITAALGQIRAIMPPGQVLTTMALAASGKDIAVREGSSEWEATSGQYALPLAKTGKVTHLRATPTASPVSLAHEHYRRGHTLEETDVVAARAAYLDALTAQEDHLESRINLGRLLHFDGQLKEAEKVYRQAKTSSALLSFNLAVLLEDLDREDEAIAVYRDALAQDPLMHDAHFNLSRLHEKANQPRDALRHLLAYRRHVSRHGE